MYALYFKIQPYCQLCFCTSYVHSTLPSSAFDGKLAGHAVEYSDLTYVLVAGAGHNVSREKLDCRVASTCSKVVSKSKIHISDDD